MSFKPAPEPATLLGRQRVLSPTASVRVSPLCLGAMNFGTAWEEYLGKCDKETSFAMMDHFFGQSSAWSATLSLTQSASFWR